MPRLRDLISVINLLPTGAHNSITDVSGVRVGHTTILSGEGALHPGTGPVRTGVTAILPHEGNLFRDKVSAAVHTINGFGKALGFEQVREMGSLETPILLTNTLNVGKVHDAVVGYMCAQNPDIGISTTTVNPFVMECSDAFLNDIQGRHCGEAHVLAAIAAAADQVIEGNVGAGTAMACYQYKGGIGTASRTVFDGQFTIGVLTQTNMGLRPELRVMGIPVGWELRDELLPKRGLGPGSINFVIATDAPLNARQLRRLAVRATHGFARTGAVSQNGSGDFVVAFSTTHRRRHDSTALVEPSEIFVEQERTMDPLFTGVVEATEEAILNALIAAEDMTGRDGNTLYALPHDRLVAVARRYGRG